MSTTTSPARGLPFLLATALVLILAASTADDPDRITGGEIEFGEGSVSTYAELDAEGAPSVIGILFTPEGLNAPPEGMSDLSHCVDRNEDGTVDKPAECAPTHEFVVPMPEEVVGHDDIPFNWVLLNWNPMGHMPPGVYDTPHFDIHFMIESEETILSIEDGPCGPEFVRCDQFELARKPVPVNYMHADFKDVEAVAPAMGNHLVDLTAPEFGEEGFTRTWIYGVYDGRVTFYEEMATLEHILSRPNTCYPIKTTPAVATSGYYPTSSCIRYDESAQAYSVSMEDFEYREAEEPVME